MPRGPVETKPPAERAVMVLVNPNAEDDEYAEEELTSLCEAAGVEPVAVVRQRVDHPTTATYIGRGKVEDVLAAVKDERADIALFDCELSAIQQRNLSDELRVKVLDRTQLILDIFAHRAHTREGIVQVALAQYTYLLPRITSFYTKFERQKGGIGMRGPGEQQLESDRRRIRDRITALRDELEHIRSARERQRKGRRKHPFPFATIVGYTSAGKSTLMNRLAGSELFADPMLFATLDPTTRKVDLPDGYSLFVTDTVGFVRNLPTKLVAAFRATLEEVTDADFLIHVIDVSHHSWRTQRDAVMETLESLGAEKKPILSVFNKIDRLHDTQELRQAVADTPDSVDVSALTGKGIDDLIQALTKMIRSLLHPIEAVIPYAQSGLLQECYDYGRVLSIEHLEDGIHVRAEVTSEMHARLSSLAK